MFIRSFLDNNRSDHNNVLNLLLVELKSANFVVRPFQPFWMKFRYNGLGVVFNEFVMAFPMVILAIHGETCCGG